MQAPGFRMVTFSVMATRGHQSGRRGIAAHPDAAPWERRREVCLRYLQQGGFDVIGLKHCHLAPGSPRCAVSFLLAGLNREGDRYGCLNAVVRQAPDDPPQGDSLAILYDRRIWELDAARSGEVWHRTAAPEGQPGGHGTLFNFAALRRIVRQDGLRPSRLHVYNIRMRDKHSRALDLYRALCFGEILAHMQAQDAPDTPAVLLCDTNCKVVDSIADRLIRGLPAWVAGLELRPQMALQDSYLALHPDAHGRVRTQHNFVDPGSIAGTERNNRILFCGDLEVTSAAISPYSEDGVWPSYHYPVEAGFRSTSVA